MKRLSVILVSFLLYLPLCAQFKGTVSVDTNQSGIVDKGDKPLAGVMVTDVLQLPRDLKHNNSTFLPKRTEKATILS